MTRYARLKKDITLWHNEAYDDSLYAAEGTIVGIISFTNAGLAALIHIGNYEAFRPVTDLEFLE